MTGRQITLSDLVENHKQDCMVLYLAFTLGKTTFDRSLDRLENNLSAIHEICNHPVNIDDWDWNSR